MSKVLGVILIAVSIWLFNSQKSLILSGPTSLEPTNIRPLILVTVLVPLIAGLYLLLNKNEFKFSKSGRVVLIISLIIAIAGIILLGSFFSSCSGGQSC